MLAKLLKMKQKKKGWLLSTLASSLLGNILTGKEAKAKTYTQGVIRAGKSKIRAGQYY